MDKILEVDRPFEQGDRVNCSFFVRKGLDGKQRKAVIIIMELTEDCEDEREIARMEIEVPYSTRFLGF